MLVLTTLVMIVSGRWRPALMELMGVDAAGHWAWLRSTVIDGDLRFGNDYQGIMEPHLWPAHSEPLPTGHHANPFPIGTAIALAPLFLLTHALLLWTPLGARFPADGFSLPYGVAAFWSQAIWASIGLFAMHAWLRRWWPRGPALAATLLVWLSTNALYYTFPHVLNNHSIELAGMPLFLLAWARWQERPSASRALTAGLASGALFLIRWQLVLWPAVLWTAEVLRGRSQRLVPRWLWLMPLPGLVLALPQLAAWRVIYGEWLTIPQGGGYIHWSRPLIHLLLFSTNRGWITWTPLVAIGLLGIAWGWRRDRWFAAVFLAGLVCQLYISAVVTDWHGAWGYGARRLAHCAPLVAWGLAALLMSLTGGRRRPLLHASLVLSLFAVWNALFLVQYYQHLIPYHRALTWHELAGDKFHLAASLERRFAVRNVAEFTAASRAARESGDMARTREALDLAAAWLARARRADPRHEDVFLAAAMLAMEQEDPPRAIFELERCLDEIGQDRAEITAAIAVCALYGGRPDVAIHAARRSLDLRPGYPVAQGVLEDALDGRRDREHTLFFY